MNLGIDFGSTYTVISTYRKDLDKVEALEASEASPYIPSEQGSQSQERSEGLALLQGFQDASFRGGSKRPADQGL